MRREDILPWYELLQKRVTELPTHTVGVGLRETEEGWRSARQESRISEPGATEWACEVGTALSAVLPVGHTIIREWQRLTQERAEGHAVIPQMIGVLKAATNLVRDDRLGTLVAAIRVEAESDLLDQADALLVYPAAAAVIAGGALETHLRHLVAKHGLSITGEGSISKYDATIGQARKAGNEVYSANVGKLVTAWGGIRNDAAHDPGTFRWSQDDVRRMIEGVRGFIDRTA